MKTRRPPCLDWREKLALRHEDLSPAEQQALDAHVRACDACSTALSDYHFFEARLDALPPPAIKPLPRLSPHFFELSSRELSVQAEQLENNTPLPAPTPRRSARKQNKVVTIAWRALSIAAVICLLLGAGALFRVIYSARLAAHPSGDTLLNLNQHTGIVNSVGWSPNGQQVATASSDGTVKVWNAQNGILICTYNNGDVIYSMAWSPNGKYIAAASGDNTVQAFSSANCSQSKTYTGHTSSVFSVAWSSDSKYLASGSSDHTALVWDVSTGDAIWSIPFNDFVSSVAWAPDSDQLAIGGWDTSIQIWDLQTKKRLHAANYTDVVNAVAWSPNGKYIAIGDANGTVEVRDTSSWKIICDYTQHTDHVNAVAWSPNGKYIASGSDDKTVRVWNPFSPTMLTLMVYTQHTEDVSSVAWSPDGKEIVSGSWDNTAKVWKVVG